MSLSKMLLACLLCLSYHLYAGDKGYTAYPIEQIKNTSTFDSSKLRDYNHFFQERMRGPSMKDGICEILFETDAFVYYGYSFFDRKTQKQSVISYYLTDKAALKAMFPKYQDENVYKIKATADKCLWNTQKKEDSLAKRKLIRTGFNAKPDYQYQGITCKLNDQNIEIEVRYKKKGHFWRQTISTIYCNTYFDKNTLTVVSSFETERIY